MPPRVPLTVRVTADAEKHLAEMADEHGVARGLVLRAMLSVATAHPDEVRAKIRAMTD